MRIEPFSNYPTSKQVGFAEPIARMKRREVPQECFRDREVMSKWIDANLRKKVSDSTLFNITTIIRIKLVRGAHFILGCDKSPILLESKENGRWPTLS
jgi:hypothetical protein